MLIDVIKEELCPIGKKNALPEKSIILKLSSTVSYIYNS